LIVPDEQLIRLGYPYKTVHILIPKRHGRLFFFDEANLSLCPEKGRIYRIKGTEYKVDTPGRNMYILGSLEYPSGEGLYEIYPHKRHEEF
jgi:hypothetical protein